MIRCRECVIPSTRPDTEFLDGVCAACIAYKRRAEVDWAARYKRLKELVSRAKATQDKGWPFDCIVPSSGGKDSTYQVLTLLELGARPLVVTAETCYLTAIGRMNIDNLARYATTLEYKPNKTVRAKLNRLGLERVGDISWPEHVSIFTIPFKLAAATGIKFLFYGENPQNQYGGPLDTLDAEVMTRRWVSEFGGFLGMRPQDLIGVDGITAADMQDYMIRPEEVAGQEAHFLGQYLPWDSHGNAAAAKNAGMTQRLPAPCNRWEFENLDNAQTGIHDHGMYRKYGFGRGCAQAAVDVRAGRWDRETALRWVEANDGKFPYVYAGVHYLDVLHQLDMTGKALENAMNKFTNWELFDEHRELQRPGPL